MSLRAFHVLFISAAVVLSLILARWLLPDNKLAAGAAVVVALGLVAYEAWFLRKTKKLV